ncbi:MAG: hypothetical protein NC548_51170 [Lachnospiraceae bacterium]|nr:hypothetical protein [Lachnospiraceae bacterium]
MHEYNSMPDNAKEISYTSESFDDFFTFQIEKIEHRQVIYPDRNFSNSHLDLKIFWIDKNRGLGYGFLNNRKENIITAYRFGSDEEWHKFKVEFALQFAGDNS